MTSINCGLKLKSPKESLLAIRERMEQLELDGKQSSTEWKSLNAILKKVQK